MSGQRDSRARVLSRSRAAALAAALAALVVAVAAVAPAAAAVFGPDYVVPSNLTAKFSTAPSKLFAKHTVSFDASASTASGDTIAQYQWNFGDGSTATTSSPTTTHVYATASTYTATLVLADPAGNTSSPVQHRLKVAGDQPHAQLHVHPSHPNVGQLVTFDGIGSSDPDGDAISSYQWSFGDGSTATTNVGLANHTYGKTGVYTVSLTVTDSGGAVSVAAVHTVTVAVPVSKKPVARFTFDPARPEVGQAVRFDGSSSTAAPGRTISGYEWSFGGHEEFTTQPVVSHTFHSSGAHLVELTVLDSHGKHSAPAIQGVDVKAKPAPSLTALRVQVCAHRSRHCRRAGLQVSFRLSQRDTVKLTLRRDGHRRRLAREVLRGRAGTNTITLAFRGRRGRRYSLTAAPRGGRRARAHFTWPR